jgi:predicted GIY-YIG superfamily endonuclease
VGGNTVGEAREVTRNLKLLLRARLNALHHRTLQRFGDIHAAIAREKQIKGLTRIKKMSLVVSMNPEWKDLSAGWFVRHRYQPQDA